MAALFRSLLKPQQVFSIRLFTINSFSFSKSSSAFELQAICRKVNPDSVKVITLFKHYGFSSDDVLDIFTKLPRVIFSNPEKNLQAKLAFLSDSGISGQHLARLICTDPHLLKRSLDRHIAPCILMLKSLFTCCDGDSIVNHLSIAQLDKALREFSWVVVPTIQTPENYQNLIRIGPRKILNDADKMREMGVDTFSLKFIISIMEYKYK